MLVPTIHPGNRDKVTPWAHNAPMASVAYQQWVSAGRPLQPARPVRDVVERMKVAYPRAAAKNLFSWYANEAHYQAVPPQDHTPFSATGWPGTSPRWWVFATDIMHRVDLGVDCNVLFPYWLREAKAGRFPSLKYIIWKATLYSVMNQWNPQVNSGHYDHIHLSFRTDYRDVSLGSWSLIPGGVDADMMFFQVIEDQAAGRMNGCTYQFAPDYPTLLKWQAKFPNAPTARVAKADLMAGLYGVNVDSMVNVPGGPVPAPGTGVSEDQVHVIARAEISAARITPAS